MFLVWRPNLSDFTPEFTKKLNCKDWRAANDILEAGFTCMGHWYTTPYKHRKRKSKMMDFQKLLWGCHYKANFLTKNRHQPELFESYVSEVLWDYLGLFIFSNWRSKDYLERIPTIEKHMLIGWNLWVTLWLFQALRTPIVKSFLIYGCRKHEYVH